MAKYRMVRTNFWENPIIIEEMTPEDRYFFLYLLTNPQTTQIGIYKITKKKMAFDLGYSIESVQSLMKRFIEQHKLIQYNPETRELAIRDWGKYNLHRGGKPVMDCILSELNEVEDTTLIYYVAQHIEKGEIRSLFESFCNRETVEKGESFNTESNVSWDVSSDDTLSTRITIRGQKEKEKEKENKKEKQQQTIDIYPDIVNDPLRELPTHRLEDTKEIIEFWDQNGFGVSNIHAKGQLLCLLECFSFDKAKETILEALRIACCSNNRRLSYVIGILKNWEKQSLLIANGIELSDKSQKAVTMQKSFVKSSHWGSDIPKEFVLDITAGEDDVGEMRTYHL